MASTLFCILPAMAGEAPISVKWEMGENGVKPGYYSSRFVITNISDTTLGDGWGFYYNTFPRKVEIAPGCKAEVSTIVPNYYKITPGSGYEPLQPGDSLVVDMMTKGVYGSASFNPDGGHFAFNDRMDNPMPVKIIVPTMQNPAQWSIPGKEHPEYPDGNYVYNLNESINPEVAKYNSSVYDIFPTPKSIIETEGVLKLDSPLTIVVKNGATVAGMYLEEKLSANGLRVETSGGIPVELSLLEPNGKNKEYYELTVEPAKITIAGASQDGVLNGVKTLMAVIETGWAYTNKELPCVKITDYPDLNYRGFMLDIARNFTRYDNILQLIDLLASYKINHMQFHLTDDEAWRIEIPGLPELTQVGARKGLTLDEKEFMVQTYRGSGNPNDTTTTANGFITREQFVELLKYAASRGVTVIPEVESPGHARAAIVSMRHRHAKYMALGDTVEAERYKLWDDGDCSEYTSAQGFHDNVMNIAGEGTYRFMEKVIDELALMYKDAGLEMKIMHIGGDEVATGAWLKSPMVQGLMQRNGYKTTHEAHGYFVDRISDIIASKGMKTVGWQEVATDRDKGFSSRVSPRFAGVNAWSTVGSRDIVPYTLANDGYPVILSNVNNFYFDMVYSYHQSERGLSWGGITNEFTSWEAQPFNIYRTRHTSIDGQPVNLAKAADGKPGLELPQNIIGVQAQTWAEAVDSYEMIQNYYFPKVFGLAERGWNAYPAWGTDYKDLSRYYKERSQYNLKIGLKELPRLFNKGVSFHIGQPGIIVKNGKLVANTQYPGVTVRYTLDGSEPTRESAMWTEPVDCGGASVIKARAYYLGKESVTTFLFVK